MKIGDYIVLGLSFLLAAASTADYVMNNYWEGFAFMLGYFMGGFVVVAVIGYLVLFAYRYVNEHYFIVKK